jgi:hypothetical protein
MTCAACGASATGNFCANCGAAVTSRSCPGCGNELDPAANFCAQCGAGAAAGTRAASPGAAGRGLVPMPASDRTPWIIATALCAITIAAVLYAANKRTPPEAPSMANAGNAVTGIADDPGAAPAGQRAPDISNLTPRQQFNRLEGRIDSMLQHGDTTNVAFFMQMSLQAYANLPAGERDIDAQYHAAIRQAQLGSLDTARAMADTIMHESPDNLLGDVVRAMAAEFAADSTALRAARTAFRTHFDAEMAKKRPEYLEHQAFLDQFRQTTGAP